MTLDHQPRYIFTLVPCPRCRVPRPIAASTLKSSKYKRDAPVCRQCRARDVSEMRAKLRRAQGDYR